MTRLTMIICYKLLKDEGQSKPSARGWGAAELPLEP